MSVKKYVFIQHNSFADAMTPMETPKNTSNIQRSTNNKRLFDMLLGKSGSVFCTAVGQHRGWVAYRMTGNYRILLILNHHNPNFYLAIGK